MGNDISQDPTALGDLSEIKCTACGPQDAHAMNLSVSTYLPPTRQSKPEQSLRCTVTQSSMYLDSF